MKSKIEASSDKDPSKEEKSQPKGWYTLQEKQDQENRKIYKSREWCQSETRKQFEEDLD